MPELPEVETLRRQLNKAIKGKTIAQVEVLRQKSFQGNKNKLLGKKVKEPGRWGASDFGLGQSTAH